MNDYLKNSVRNRKRRLRHKEYAKLVSKKLEVFMADYNKDPIEMAYLAGVRYQTIMDIYWENPVEFMALCHVSSCIDAIRHNRYYCHNKNGEYNECNSWRILPEPMYAGDDACYPYNTLEYFIYDKDWKL